MYRITPVLSGEWLRDSDLMVGDLVSYTNPDEHIENAAVRVKIVGAGHVTAVLHDRTVFASIGHFKPKSLPANYSN